MKCKIAEFNTEIVGNYRAVTRICNAEAGDFGLIDAEHELSGESLEP